jgi:tripeptidyl-peptidase I
MPLGSSFFSEPSLHSCVKTFVSTANMVAFVLFILTCLHGVLSLDSSRTAFTAIGALSSVPNGWTQVRLNQISSKCNKDIIADRLRQGDQPDPNEQLKLYLHLIHEDESNIRDRLLSISTPGHSLYGQFLDNSGLDHLLRPSAENTTLVLHWLSSAGISQEQISQFGDTWQLTPTVAQAELLLNTNFTLYHNDDGITTIRTLEYSVPTTLASLVKSIQPTTRFGRPKSVPRTNNALQARSETATQLDFPYGDPSWWTSYNTTFCNSTITPACLRGLYNMGDFAPEAKNPTKIGIAGFSGDSVILQDVQDFLTLLNIPDTLNLKVVPVSGGFSAANGGPSKQTELGNALVCIPCLRLRLALG